MRKPIVLDLFAGAGGLSLGFEQAGLPIALAADLDPINVDIYRRNLQGARAVATDLSQTSGKDLLEGSGICPGHVDVVIGGPPCQGFSMIGSRRTEDPRNQLIFDFLRIVAQTQARYFVMENVPGIRTGKMAPTFARWLSEAKHLGYTVIQPIWQLNAADFGVPQNRIRCFAVGYRYDCFPPSIPQPGKTCSAQCQIGLRPTVGDAISDLPEPTRFTRLLKSDRIPTQYGTASTYAQYMRGEQKDPCDHYGPHDLSTETLTGFKRTVHTNRSKRRFQRTKPGATESISRFPKLDFQGIAPTLRAGTRFDSSGFTAARPLHPERPRCITVREAARLQSFPDWFEFHPTIWHGFRQVGNSVPPLLARAIGQQIAIALQTPRYSAQMVNNHQQVTAADHFPIEPSLVSV